MNRRMIYRWELRVILFFLYLTKRTVANQGDESCSGKLKSTVISSQITTPLNQNAGWMKDPLQVSDRLYYMSYEKFLTRHLFEYETAEGLKGAETAKAFYNLPDAVAGTGFVVYDRNIFYTPEETRKVVRFDLTTQSVEAEVTIPEANYDGISPYSIDLSTDIDLAVDENGLWAIYATEYNNGNIVISRLDHQTLSIEQTWTTDYYKLSALNAFVACGCLYTVSSSSLRIDFTFNTTSNVGTTIDVDIPMLSSKASSMNYNAKEKKLYVWDDRKAVSYKLQFEKIAPSTRPPFVPVYTSKSTTTTTTTTATKDKGDSDPAGDGWRRSTRSPWSRRTTPTTMTRSQSLDSTAAVVSNSRHLVMLRVGLTISICLLVAAGVVIFFCVLPSEKREYVAQCCWGLSHKSPNSRYGNHVQYTGSIANSLYGGHLGDTGFSRAAYVGDDPNYCRSCSTVTGCTTTLLPLGEIQAPLLHKPPPPLERTARSMSEMDVGRVIDPGTRYHNTVAHGGYTKHLPTSTCACYNHLHDECPCGTFCQLPPPNCAAPSAVNCIQSESQFRQSPHYYETVDRNFLQETPEGFATHFHGAEPGTEEYQTNDEVHHCARNPSPFLDEEHQAELAGQTCNVENPNYGSHMTPNYGRTRSVESLPAQRPRIKMGTSGLQLLNARGDISGSPGGPCSSQFQSNLNKRSSDPLSMDLGYVTDNQNLDCSQCGQVHGDGCPQCRSPSSDVQKPTLVVRSLDSPSGRLDTVLESSNGRNCRSEGRRKRISVHNTSDFSDCPSENDREVERITRHGDSAKSAINSSNNPSDFYHGRNRTLAEPADGEMIETDTGGRISAAETVTSWSAYAGSDASATNSSYGSHGPRDKRLSDFQTGQHSNFPNGQSVSPHNKKYTYTLPGTAAAVTKAKIDLKAGGISMITNL